MPPRQNESYVIKPAAPDTSVRGLLVLPFAQTLPEQKLLACHKCSTAAAAEKGTIP